jgi:hypothetical protein
MKVDERRRFNSAGEQRTEVGRPEADGRDADREQRMPT